MPSPGTMQRCVHASICHSGWHHGEAWPWNQNHAVPTTCYGVPHPQFNASRDSQQPELWPDLNEADVVITTIGHFR